MVVFVGDETMAEAEAAAAGAKSVRFTEVEIRAAQATTSRHKPLDASASAPDGIVFVANDASSSPSLSALAPLVGENTVLASVGARAIASEAASRGGIVVSTNDGDAGKLGARVAKVAGWVRHALGHEAEAHSHGHTHDHDHHHHHHDKHAH